MSIFPDFLGIGTGSDSTGLASQLRRSVRVGGPCQFALPGLRLWPFLLLEAKGTPCSLPAPSKCTLPSYIL